MRPQDAPLAVRLRLASVARVPPGRDSALPRPSTPLTVPRPQYLDALLKDLSRDTVRPPMTTQVQVRGDTVSS